MATGRVRRSSTGGDEVLKRLVRKRLSLAVSIADALERRDWTARRLAQEAGLKESFLSRILRGDANSTLKTIVKIEAALGEEVLVASSKYAGPRISEPLNQP